jgi:hypothetical protein
VPSVAVLGANMILALVKCSLSSTKSIASKIKTLYALGDSLSVDTAADFVKTFQSELKCLVQKSTDVYDGYFNSLAISIEGSVSSGTSLAYSFGLSIDNNGDAVVFYSQCYGLTIAAGADGSIGLAF